MPILNMVWWWKKWGNIWEPLNLTVTTSWLDATIKWEDNEIWTIPPTTFQKSELVRKIGSAPTSPSDWDLVVTETVKDTYKTTWYVDQWLTDGETYYYRVFSYSDLWWISYCDAVNVIPSAWWWQPWVNTIFYYNIDGTDDNSTLYDKSGNWYDLTWNKTPTYVTDATYGRVVQSTWASTATAYRNYIDLWTTQTCNVLINVTGNSWWDTVLLSWATGLQLSDMDWVLHISPTSLELRNESQNTNISTTNSWWELITVTRDTNWVIFYKNWTQIGTWSYYAVTYSNYLQLFNSKDDDIWWTSYVKMVMMEDKVWTQQEIQDLATEYWLI